MDKVAEAPRMALDLPPLGKRAAYGRLAGLVAVVWGLQMFLEAVVDFAPGFRWLITGWDGTGVMIAASGLWLTWLAYRHNRPPWQYLGAAATTLFGVWVIPGRSDGFTIPLIVFSAIVEIILIGAVAWDAGISPRRQLGYKPSWAANRSGRYNGLGVFFRSFEGFAATAWIQFFLSLIPGPQMEKPQSEVIGIKDMSGQLIAATTSGFYEEILLTAALVVFMLAARRPLWQIAIVAAVLRIIPHLYMGIPCLGVAVFAVWNVILFARSRRIAPIIAAHVVINIASILQQRTGMVPMLIFLGAVLGGSYYARRKLKPPTPHESQADKDSGNHQSLGAT